jgi:hypothetical protein
MEKPDELNEAELDMATMAQMALHGSPFFQRLGVALGFATLEEVRAIQTAFPHVWATYREMASRVSRDAPFIERMPLELSREAAASVLE